jgi:integrase
MLTDIECKNLKPKEKIYCKTDGYGMYLEIYPNGGKYWRLKYRIAGKQKRIALGVYPQVSPKEARLKRDKYRAIVREGYDPGELRKMKKLEIKENAINTFENIAREWFEKKKGSITSRHAFYIIRRLETNVFPYLGGVPLKKIKPQELLEVIREIENRGSLEVAHRVMQVVGQVFRYAVSSGRAEHDITADLKGALLPVKENHYAYFSEREFKEFLKRIDTLKMNLQTKLAFKLLVLTFVRSGELRGTKRNEFDLKKKEWRIPADRMKMKEQHIVPLSRQAINTLEEIKRISLGTELLFPCRTDINKPISDNTLSKALRDNGYRGKATPHGIRATASTILNENGFSPDVIERQLAHCERNKIRAAYNHAQFLAERREMMDWWGEFVDKGIRG